MRTFRERVTFASGNYLWSLFLDRISEIVDSSLIGEGILPSLRHAIENLLEPEHVMVPYAAKVYAKLIECPTLWNFQSLDNNENFLNFKFGVSSLFYRLLMLIVDENARGCPGSTEVPLEIILEDVESKEQIDYLSDTITVHSFEFSKLETLQSPNSTREQVKVKKSGQCHGVLLWWDMFLDSDSEIVVSTCPWGEGREWRNHWKQCIYFFDKPVDIVAGRLGLRILLTQIDSSVFLVSSHDDFNLWFNLSKEIQSEPQSLVPVPLCACGLHSLYR